MPFQLQKFITNSTKLQKKYETTWVRCQFHLSFKENSLKKSFKKLHLPKIHFQLLNGQFMNLYPYLKMRKNEIENPRKNQTKPRLCRTYSSRPANFWPTLNFLNISRTLGQPQEREQRMLIVSGGNLIHIRSLH